jgi:hypothetical protein
MTVKIGTITYVCLYFNTLTLMIHYDITSLFMITVTCLPSNFLPKFQCYCGIMNQFLISSLTDTFFFFRILSFEIMLLNL